MSDQGASSGDTDNTAERASSFGGVASLYERYRPGPPVAAVDWFVPDRVGTIVDLGAGTGALTRLLVGRADDVVAVEPDDRMRAVLEQHVPGARALSGRGEDIPLPGGCADAVLASSSWHWMDPVATLNEATRVLVPRGLAGAVWAGPDAEGPFMKQAATLLAEQAQRGGGGTEVSDLILGAGLAPTVGFAIPPGLAYEEPEHEVFQWEIALNADELIGLLGTLSWVITLPDERRERLNAEARRLLRELLGIEGAVTVDVAYRADAWRTRRID